MKQSVVDRLRECSKRNYAFYYSGILDPVRFTQEYIARELGVSERTVRRWIKGESKPRRGNLIKIGKLINRFDWQLLTR